MADALRSVYPDATLLLPEGLALADLAVYVREQQQRLAVVNPDTALIGFAEGATLALDLSARADGLVGRVLAFAGRYTALPARAPELTSIHLFHGEDDAVVPVSEARETYEHLAELYGDVTLDTASNVGHALHPALVDQAILRLQTCVPLRTWRRALGMD